MNPPPISSPRLFVILLWAQWRTMLARIAGLRRQSPLLLLVLLGFVLGYIGSGYYLFHAGLGYLYHFPLVGNLLSQRVLFLIFGFFFVMLMFSNVIIGYSTLFKNRETQWLLAMPIAHRDVYRWKFLESLTVSSWALLFLSAPLMAAYGRVHDVSFIFYFQVALLFIPFVIIPALLGSWLILLLVRVLARLRIKKRFLFLGAAAVLLLIFALKPVTEVDAMNAQEVVTFEKLLRHTRISTNPWLPSVWFTQSVIAWGSGLNTQGNFYFLLLLSNALMGLVLGFEGMGRLFYGSLSASHNSRAERFLNDAHAKRSRGLKDSALTRVGMFLLRPFSQPCAALALKDIRLFWREPAQWIQFMIFFALLCTYVLNLRNVTLDVRNPFWETTISYLNLAASALTLSTLTTRFVFPQFSLEGRRLWLIGLAPIGLRKVLLQKFWLSCITAMLITVSLMVASSVMLHQPWRSVFFFAGSIALMSAALNGLAVGLGALFPNFKEDNPSKIVSGFGGTLCLILSFIYIASFVGIAALPDLRRVAKVPFAFPDWLAYAIPIAMSAALLFVPMVAAMRRVDKLEI